MLRHVFSLCLLICSQGYALDGSFSVGADHWSVSDGPAPRYRPDYSTPNPWKPTSGFLLGKATHQLDLGRPVTLSVAGQYSEINGGRLDRADLDVLLSYNQGVRVGQLPYRISWSRRYSRDNPWIAEPDAFLHYFGLNEISQGSPGVQIYTTSYVNNWVVDSLVGNYAPMIAGPDSKLGPYVSVGPNIYHRKHGASVNGVNLATGTQLRASWLYSAQDQLDHSGDAHPYTRQLRWNTYFLGAETNVTRALALRVTYAGYIGNQINTTNATSFDGRSLTLEGVYTLSPGHYIALGQTLYTNKTLYVNHPGKVQFLKVPAWTLSYRKDFSNGWYGVVEYMYSDDSYERITGAKTLRQGSATGIRLAKSFTF